MSLQNISIQNRQVAYDWFDQSPQERETNSGEMRKSLHLSAPRFRLLRDDWRKDRQRSKVETREVKKIRQQMNDVLLPEDSRIIVEHGNKIVPEDEEIEEGDSELQQVLRNLFRLSKKNSNAAKVWLQATNNLVEKAEVKIGLTADEIARRNIEADRRIRVGHRVESVPEKPPLLPDKVRED